MVPEGLQYQSVETIVSKIKSLGMNSIRLTYATELIDQSQYIFLPLSFPNDFVLACPRVCHFRIRSRRLTHSSLHEQHDRHLN